MKNLLHIVASPREDESRTLKITQSFLEVFKKKHLDWRVDELNLFTEELPSLTVRQVDGKYILLGGKDLSGEFKQAWKEITAHIERFLSADAYLISTPMWNFSIPYVLKQYIDIIVQPKYLFQYAGGRVEGLVKNKKMVVVSTRGGDYSAQEMRAYDLQELYLRTIFGFVGLDDITFVIAQPMDMGPKIEKEKIQEAQGIARKTAERL